MGNKELVDLFYKTQWWALVVALGPQAAPCVTRHSDLWSRSEEANTAGKNQSGRTNLSDNLTLLQLKLFKGMPFSLFDPAEYCASQWWKCVLGNSEKSEVQTSNHHLGVKRIERRSSDDLHTCGASANSARTMARAERRLGMASIARSNTDANPDVSLELALSTCVSVRRHLRTRLL